MKPLRILQSGLLFALAPFSFSQINVTESSYSAEVRYGVANSFYDVFDYHDGTALGGGSVSAYAEGNFEYSSRVTNHLGTASLTTSNQGGGLLGNYVNRARTIYLSGGYPYLNSATVSTFGNTVKFTVAATGAYRVDTSGLINLNQSSPADRPPGSYFLYLRLNSSISGSVLDVTSAWNSSSLSSLPFSQIVTLTAGPTYTLAWSGACNGVTLNESWQGPSGSFGQTGFYGSYSITPLSTVVTQFRGTVTFLDWLGGNRPYTVELRDPNTNALLQSANFTSLGASGEYAFSTLASVPANAKLTLKPQGSLRSSATVSLGGGTQTANFSIRPGDVDGSGEVDAADIDSVIGQFGAFGGVCDADGSGEVDAADIDLVIQWFGDTDN